MSAVEATSGVATAAGASVGHPAVIYIAGYGRSGSSVLGLLLGGHEAVVNAGAVGQAAAERARGGACSCGEPVGDCPFWKPLLAAGVPPAPQLVRAVSVASGTSCVIDGSKSTYRYFLRPWRYARSGLPVHVLHLVRHPVAVMRSALKGQNSLLESGSSGARPFEHARTLWGWLYSNLLAVMYRLLMPRSYFRVNYADLCVDPERVLARIGDRAGLDYSRVGDRIATKQPFEAGHALAGNRLLRSGKIVFRTGQMDDLGGRGVWFSLARLLAFLFRVRA